MLIFHPPARITTIFLRGQDTAKETEMQGGTPTFVHEWGGGGTEVVQTGGKYRFTSMNQLAMDSFNVLQEEK
jgi:hypothetical protein